MDIKEIEQYVNVIIPNIEKELREVSDESEQLKLYNLYEDVLLMVAPYDFISYNKALEFYEDKSNPNRGFYHHRQNHIREVFDALNDMEVYDKYDMLLISMSPRIGKTTSGIRFLSWIMGKHPENTQLATSYSDSITSSFYAGVMEIVESEQYKKVFPDVPLVNQNAKRQEIWMKVVKRYPTISFVSIGGSMVGRSEAGNYLYVDDLVSGIEESISITRMEKLWQLYTVNATQRKKDGAKEIHIATRWSVHDPITKLTEANKDNPRCKVINLPCFDDNGESNFDFFGGFSTKYYRDLQKGMDELSFNALYLGEPVEREGLLYYEDDLQYYLELPPKEQLDTIVSVCDSKALGKDFVASPIGYIYGDLIYIEDVVYNNGLPEITVPAVASKWYEHKVVRGDVEMNAGGNFFATGIDEKIKKKGGDTSIRMFFTSQNKRTKIITYSDFIKKHFVFKDPSQYHPNSEYAEFMKGLFTWTQTGNNKNDDAPDSISMLAQLVQDLQGNSVKFLNRSNLGL